MNSQNKSRNNQKRGKKRPYNDKRFSKRQITDEDVKESGKGYESKRPMNDPAYYNKYPELVKDVASFWFSKPLGFPIKQFSDEADYIETAPGICTLYYIPGPGVSNSPASAVNTVARAAYVFQRYVNSGSKTYEPADLMMYFLAMDSAYQMWAVGRRAIGLARLFSASNRYRAKEMLKACGFDPSVMEELPRLRAVVNNFAARISSFAVPGTMDYFKRHAEVNQVVFMDANSNKSQMYVMVPSTYYVYTESEAKLTHKSRWLYDYWTVDTYEAALNEIAAPIVLSEDFGIMSGDVVKAYKDNIMRLSLTPEDYITPIVYDEVMLSQIENAMVVSAVTTDIIQDRETGSILWTPGLTGGDLTFNSEPVVNMHTDAPTSDELMEATRLMVKAEPGDTYIQYCGTEIITNMWLWNFRGNGETAYTLVSGAVGYLVHSDGFLYAGDVTNLQGALKGATQLSQFHRHPRFFVCEKDLRTGDDAPYVAKFMSWEVENMVGVKDTLAGIHETALLSLFNTGRIALG